MRGDNECRCIGPSKRMMWHAGIDLGFRVPESVRLCQECVAGYRRQGIRLWNSRPSHRQLEEARAELRRARGQGGTTRNPESGEGGRSAHSMTSTSKLAATASGGGQPAPSTPAVATPDRRGSAGGVDPAVPVNLDVDPRGGANASGGTGVTASPAKVGATVEVEGQPAPASAVAAPTPEDKVRTCDVPGCDDKHKGRGRCALHYGRARLAGFLDGDPEDDLKRWDEHQARLAAEREAQEAPPVVEASSVEPVAVEPVAVDFDVTERDDDEPSVEDLAVGGTDPAAEPFAAECDGDNDQDVCTEPELGGDCVGNDCDGSQLEEAPGEAAHGQRLWAVLQDADGPFDGAQLLTIVEATSADAALYFGLISGQEPPAGRFAREAGIDDVYEYLAHHTRVNRSHVASAEARAMRAELQVAALVALRILPADAAASGVHAAAWRKLLQLLTDVAYSGQVPDLALAAK